ncbi:MAG: hypothetical protein ACE366_16725 [Bradymonadia bacterium]
MSDNWYIRGSKPDRNFEAFLLVAAPFLLGAAIKQDRSLAVEGLTRALGAGSAQSEHRVKDRASANQRNQQLAKPVADLINALWDRHDQHRAPLSSSERALRGG